MNNFIGEYTIPLAALIISSASIFFTVLSLKNKANGDYVVSIATRVKILEEKIRECERHRDELFDENISLMKKIVKS